MILAFAPKQYVQFAKGLAGITLGALDVMSDGAPEIVEWSITKMASISVELTNKRHILYRFIVVIICIRDNKSFILRFQSLQSKTSLVPWEDTMAALSIFLSLFLAIQEGCKGFSSLDLPDVALVITVSAGTLLATFLS